MTGQSFTPRDQIWNYIRRRKKFTVKDVVVVTRLPYQKAYQYIRALRSAGILIVENPKASFNEHKIYILKKDMGEHAPDITCSGKPRVRSANQKCWAAIRVLRQFTAADLALPTRLAVSTVTKYLHALEKAGYIRIVARRKGAADASVYRYIPSKDTGPHAPTLKADGSMYDRNLDNRRARHVKG